MPPDSVDRVRLVDPEPTMGGTSFSEGELMIVDELRLAPAGFAWVHLRSPDGRALLTGTRGTFVPA